MLVDLDVDVFCSHLDSTQQEDVSSGCVLDVGPQTLPLLMVRRRCLFPPLRGVSVIKGRDLVFLVIWFCREITYLCSCDEFELFQRVINIWPHFLPLDLKLTVRSAMVFVYLMVASSFLVIIV